MREKLKTLPLAQLKELAKSQGIKGISAMRKAEIIELLCQAAEENPKVQDHARLGSRSHNDGPGKSRSMPADVLPCQERSHTVSQQEIRDMGIFRLCQCPQGVDISEHAGVAVWFREISAVFLIRYGGTVPQVIVSGDQIALFAEKVGKLFISPDKFAHAVTDLQYSPDVSLRDPFDRVNPGFLIG